MSGNPAGKYPASFTNFDDPFDQSQTKNVSDGAALFPEEAELHIVSDCKIMEDMMSRLQNAYELVTQPLRKELLFCPRDSEIAFLNKTVFPVLLPAMSRALQLAKLSNSLQHQMRSFNGLDTIVEYLWNNNPKHPLRPKKRLFHIPFVKKHLKINPRRYYPRSIYFTEDEAASVIQAHVKGYLVRCTPDVQEMRLFWKKIKAEKQEQYKEHVAAETKDEDKQNITET